MAFAARLASKRKEAEEAGEDGELTEDKGLGRGAMSSLLQQGKDKEGDEQLRNPFADDEDDDEQSDDEDEEDDEGDLGRGDNASGQGGSWNRGGWWRGALGSRNDKSTKETFGDGRDSSNSEDEAEGQAGDGGNSSDEEFGDFAMPETSGAAAEASGATSGFDAEREKVLVKPMPVHPPGGGGNKGNFLGLWPFAKKDKDSSPTKEESVADKEKTADAAATTEKPVEAQAADEAAKEEKEKGAATEKDGVKEDGTTKAEPPVVLSEDGEKVQQAVEAKRRTSIEEPDEGDEVVV
jgi:SIT4-associating protein SAP185/190